jgi:hypothetical protein
MLPPLRHPSGPSPPPHPQPPAVATIQGCVSNRNQTSSRPAGRSYHTSFCDTAVTALAFSTRPSQAIRQCLPP